MYNKYLVNIYITIYIHKLYLLNIYCINDILIDFIFLNRRPFLLKDIFIV